MLDFSNVRLESFKEGLCVQIMHIGPYSEEIKSMDKINTFINNNGYKNLTGAIRKHHEIYLSDPRRVLPERLRTVLRNPISI